MFTLLLTHVQEDLCHYFSQFQVAQLFTGICTQAHVDFEVLRDLVGLLLQGSLVMEINIEMK